MKTKQGAKKDKPPQWRGFGVFFDLSSTSVSVQQREYSCSPVENYNPTKALQTGQPSKTGNYKARDTRAATTALSFISRGVGQPGRQLTQHKPAHETNKLTHTHDVRTRTNQHPFSHEKAHTAVNLAG